MRDTLTEHVRTEEAAGGPGQREINLAVRFSFCKAKPLFSLLSVQGVCGGGASSVSAAGFRTD
jgi:hypothetical protein